MKFLLDTNAVIALLRGDRSFLSRLTEQTPANCLISAIVAHELFYGAYKGRRTADNLARISAMRFEILAFDNEDARCAGKIRAVLAQAGTPIGAYDILIAGQALARNMTLVTHNMREFSRVPELNVEDWEG